VKALLVAPCSLSLSSTPSVPAREAEVNVLAAFDAIYDQHVTFVWRTLRAFGVPGGALEDAVQDVFLIVHRNLPTFEPRGKMTTWLFEIARRIASNYRRARVNDDGLPVTEELLRDPRPTPFDEAATAEAMKLVEQALDQIDEKYRVCFVLMEFEQMTAEEVAALLGLHTRTVYSRTHRARLVFDRLVKRYGIHP